MRMKLSIGNESAEIMDSYSQTSFEDSVLAIAEAQGQVCSAEIELHNALVELDSQCMYVENFTEIALTEAAFGYTQSLAALFGEQLTCAGYGVGNEAGVIEKNKNAISNGVDAVKKFFAKVLQMLKNFFKFVTDRNYRLSGALKKEAARVKALTDFDKEKFDKTESKVYNVVDTAKIVEYVVATNNDLARLSAANIITKYGVDIDGMSTVKGGKPVFTIDSKFEKVRVSAGNWSKERAVDLAETIAKTLNGSAIVEKNLLKTVEETSRKALEELKKSRETGLREYAKLKTATAKGSKDAADKLGEAKTTTKFAAFNFKAAQAQHDFLIKTIKEVQMVSYAIGSDLLVVLRAFKPEGKAPAEKK